MPKSKLKKRAKQANKHPFVEKLIALGILLFLLGTITHLQIFTNALISQREQPKKVYVAQDPSSISIPSVRINVKVDEGGIASGNWILSSDKALYLPTSGKIGEGYNTIIYAHDTNNLFGPLLWVKKGDLILLTDRKGKEFKYKIFSTEEVDPKDLSKLYSTEKNIVTLFTCDGWFDEKRLLVKAKLLQKS